MQSVTVQSPAKVAESAPADPTAARPDASFDLIGFVQVAASAQATDPSGLSPVTDGAAAKPLDPLTALMNLGQLADKGLTTSAFTEAVAEDQGLKIHVFPTPDGATVDTIRELPMVTAADLEHAVSLLPASAEKDMVLSLIHDPQTIAAAMKASGLFNPRQMQVAGQDLPALEAVATALPVESLVPQAPDARLPSALLDRDSASLPLPVDPALTDPAVFAAQQAMMMQPVLPQPVPPQSVVPDLVSAPAHDAEPVLPPEITSGPWGAYQSPVMPDERFVRFIMPKTDAVEPVTSTSLFGVDVPDGAAFAPLASLEGGTKADDAQSVMAVLADAMKGAGSVSGNGSPLAAALASFTASNDQLAASPTASLSSPPDLVPSSTPAVAPSAATLFSSIFAKHGIGSEASALPAASESLFPTTSQPDTSLTAPIAAFDGNPLKAVLASLPQAPVAPPVADVDGSGDAIRNSVLNSLGGLKTAPAKGGLASQLFNSQHILDLAAEEGLALGQAVPVSAPHVLTGTPDLTALSSLANTGFAPVPQNNAFASAADQPVSALTGNDLSAGGQGQTGGQNNNRQDGQPANPQAAARAREEAAFVSASSGSEDVIRAAAKKADAFSTLATGHQTAVASDGTGIETASFSTASMAQATQTAPVSGSSLGARDMFAGVTYALAGQSTPVTGSAVAAEMRFMSLGQQVMAALKQNSQEIELRLNPAQLGNVVLKLQVEGQKLSISAKTESQLSDEALSSGEDGLRASLAAHGYQLDKFDVSHQEERRKPNRPEAEQSHETERTSDDPFSFDLIA